MFVGSNDGNVYAHDLRTNKRVWKVATQDWINSSATVVDGVVYIGGNDRHVYAIDSATGETNWSLCCSRTG